VDKYLVQKCESFHSAQFYNIFFEIDIDKFSQYKVKTGKYNSTKRSKIRAVKIGENISVTKNVRKMVKRKMSLHNQENLCENLQNLVGM